MSMTFTFICLFHKKYINKYKSSKFTHFYGVKKIKLQFNYKIDELKNIFDSLTGWMMRFELINC